MTKPIIIFGTFLLLMMSGISHFWIFDEDVKPGQELVGHIGIWNNGKKELKSIKLGLDIGNGDFLDLGRVNIMPRTNHGKYFIYDVPLDSYKGDYLTRLTASSGTGTRLRDASYRTFRVN